MSEPSSSFFRKPSSCFSRSSTSSLAPAVNAWTASIARPNRDCALRLADSAAARLATACRHCQVTPTSPPTSASSSPAASEATAGFRRAHRHACSVAVTRRAWIGWSSRNRCRSSASAAAVGYRSAGSRCDRLGDDRLQVARDVRHRASAAARGSSLHHLLDQLVPVGRRRTPAAAPAARRASGPARRRRLARRTCPRNRSGAM